jgi:glycosyltransferase involved in cell wall biosynthesis
VLVVASTLHIGGAEQVVANLARYLDRDRFEVTACYLKQNGIVGQQMLSHGVDLVPVPGLKSTRDYLTSLKLLRLIRQRRIQLIHTHDVHGLLDGVICRSLAPRLRHVHTFHWGNYPQRDPKYARLERLLWRVPDSLVAVGHVQAAAIGNFYRIPESRLEVLWNGIVPPAPAISPEVADAVAQARGPVIGSISTLIPQKGLEFLLRAAKLLRDRGHEFLLLIAGEGNLRKSLEQQCREAGLAEHVRFLGWVADASQRALPACDIFVQSSLWEAMSVVVLEAMASAKPIVATSVGENAHVLVNRTSGIIVPPKDPQALADALEALLKDPALRARLGSAAVARYRDHFTVNRMVRDHEDLYRRLISRTAVQPAPAAD